MKYVKYDNERHIDIVDEKIIDLIKKLLSSLGKKLVYRGVSSKTYKDFLDFLFVGGEKARFTLVREDEVNNLDYSIENWGDTKVGAFNEILNKLEIYLPQFKDYQISGNIEDVKLKIEEERKRLHVSYYDMYIKVLCILHIVQDKTPFQPQIPCVSTSRSKEYAQEKFSNGHTYSSFYK